MLNPDVSKFKNARLFNLLQHGDEIRKSFAEGRLFRVGNKHFTPNRLISHLFKIISEEGIRIITQNEASLYNKFFSEMGLCSSYNEAPLKHIIFHRALLLKSLALQLQQWQTFQNPLTDQVKLPPSGYIPSFSVLKAYLDDVHTFRGISPSKCMNFLKYYFDRYSKHFPFNSFAAQVHKKLTFYIDETRFDNYVEQIFLRLEESGYVAFSGGYRDKLGGHSVYCEMFFEEEGICFRVTNSGEGLQYHPSNQGIQPPNQNKALNYRTLSFRKATLESIKETRFVEKILVFHQAKLLSNTIKFFYQVLFFAWPGSNEVVASNLGAEQRGGSCSLRSALKSTLSLSSHSPEDIKMQKEASAWIKMEALSDYITNSKNVCPNFLDKAIAKISSHCSKMLYMDILSEDLEKKWKKLVSKIEQFKFDLVHFDIEKKAIKQPAEEFIFYCDHTSFLYGEMQNSSNSNKSTLSQINYNYLFTGDFPGLSQLEQISQKNFAPKKIQIACYLNFLRSLPDCNQFTFEDFHRNSSMPYQAGKRTFSGTDFSSETPPKKKFKSTDEYGKALDFKKIPIHENDEQTIRKKFFADLGETIKNVTNQGESFFVPDGFMSDLINAWLIIYFEAKQQKTINIAVLHEWTSALGLLIKNYKKEYIFDAHSYNRMNLVEKLCESEINNFASKMRDTNLSIQPLHWNTWSKKHIQKWTPYKVESSNSLDKENLSATSLFIMDKFQNSKESLFTVPWKPVFFNESKPSDFVLAAEVRIPQIPFYDLLRESLWSLYVFGDIHIQRADIGPDLKNVVCYDENNFLCLNTFLKTSRSFNENAVNQKFYPETSLPKEREKLAEHKFLNSKIATVAKARELPFFSEVEELQWLSYVENDSATAIYEALRFFKAHFHKFSENSYQSALEHFFFNFQNYEKTLKIFNSNDPSSKALVEMIFKAVSEGCDFFITESKDSSLKIGGGAAFMLYLYCRFLDLCPLSEHSEIKRDFLFNCWEKVLFIAKNNQAVAYGLADAMFASIVIPEKAHFFKADKRFFKLMTETLLLDCLIGAPENKTRFFTMRINYGYLAFISAMNSLDIAELKILLKDCCRRFFDTEDLAEFSWNGSERIVSLKKHKIYLDTRRIEGEEGLYMQRLPEQITDDPEYKILFERAYLADFKEQGDLQTYTFNVRNREYKITCTKNDYSSFTIFKKFDEAFLPLYPHFRFQYPYSRSNKFSFWRCGEKYYVENRKTEKILAIFENGFYYRLHDGKLTGQKLAITTITTAEKFKNFSRLYWMDDQGSIFIELPKENLHFQSRIDQEGILRYYSIEYPGFRIADDQKAQFLRENSGLVLDNHEGQKKALVPYNYKGGTNFILFNFSKANPRPELAPVPKNYFSILLLFQNYLEMENFEEAIRLLKETRITSFSLHKMKEKVQELLWNIVFEDVDNIEIELIKNIPPEQAALSLHLYGWGELDYSTYSLYLLLKRCANNYTMISHFLPSDKIMEELYRQVEDIDDFEEYSEDGDIDVKKKIEGKIVPDDIGQSLYCNSLIPKDDILNTYDSFKNSDSLNLKNFPLQDSKEFSKHFLCFCNIVLNGSDIQKNAIKQIVAMQKIVGDKLSFCLCDFIIALIFKRESNASLEEKVQLFENLVLQINNKTLLHEHNECVKYIGKKLKKINYAEWVCGRVRNDYKIEICNTEPLKIIFPKMTIIENSKIGPFPKNFYSFLDLKPIEDLRTLEKNISSIKKCNNEFSLKISDLLQSWCKSKASHYGDDLLIAKQFQRMMQGCKTFSEDLLKHSEVESLTTDRKLLIFTLGNYWKNIDELSKRLRSIEKILVSDANEISENIQMQLERAQGIRLPIDLQTLLVCFGRRDAAVLKERNPSLNEAEIFTIMKRTGNYALQKSHLQHMQRSYAKLWEYYKQLTKGSLQLSYYSDEYLSTARAKRIYKASEHPEYLVFEVFNDLLIRDEQLSILEGISAPGNEWKLIEARTGIGKSKVISPLWLTLKADREHASIMIMPSALYEQQVVHIQKLLKNGYNFFATCIEFSRDSDCSAEAMHAILRSLQEAKEQGKPILMSDSTAHNLLILKIKELCHNNAEEEVLEAFFDIQRFVKNYGVLFVDEPQDVLNDGKENDYSIGNAGRIDPLRIEFCTRIYSSFLDFIDKSGYRVEFIKQKQESLLLTEEDYYALILPKLLEKLMVDENIPGEMQVYLEGKMSLEEQFHFENHLRSFALTSPHTKTIATKVRLLHDQLHHFLPQTLQKNCGEHYGLVDSEEWRIATPLESARTAKTNCEFVSQDQMINFTIQANLKIDFSSKFIRNWIEQIAEMATHEIYKGAGNFGETKAYQKWRSLMSIVDFDIATPFKVSEEKVHRLTDAINNNKDVRLEFIQIAVLQKMQSYERKASSSIHVLANCFKSLVGASGTLAMQNFPNHLEVIRAPHVSAQSIVTLLKKYERSGNSTVIEFTSKEENGIISELSNKLPDASVVIEIGAIFRSYSDVKEMALQFLKHLPRFEGIATFDSDGIPIVLSREFEHFLPKDICGIDDQKLFWIYLQKDTVGTDQKLDPFAKGIAIVNEHTTLTNFIQGIGRMRHLYLNQEVTIATDCNSAELIRRKLRKDGTKPLDFFDVLEFCILKECDSIGSANIRSIKMQHQAILENVFWEFAKEASIEDVLMEFKQFEHLLIESTLDDLLYRPAINKEMIFTDQLIDNLEANFKAFMGQNLTFLNSRNSPVYQYFNEEKWNQQMAHIRRGMDYPKMTRFSNDSLTTKVSESQTESISIEQREQEREAERQSEMEVYASRKFDVWASQMKARKPLDCVADHKVAKLEDIFKHPKLNKFLPLFNGANLLLSKNGIITFQGDSQQNSGIVNGFIKPMPYLLSLKDKFVLLDCEEAAFHIVSNRTPGMWLVNHGPLCEHIHWEKTIKTQLFCHAELAAKLLNGDFSFSPQQLEFFNKWLKEEAGRASMLLAFIHEILFALHPLLESSVEYQQLLSHLEKINIF